jgi:cytochrome c5
MFNKRLLTIGVFSLISFGALSLAWAAEDTVETRTKPVGEVCMAGQPCAAAAPVVSSGPRSAEDIYKGKCSLCHAAGIAGAPKFGDKAAWAPRIAERKKEGLYTSVLGGRGAMPAKGTCTDCTEDDIKGVVDYMVSQVQ